MPILDIEFTEFVKDNVKVLSDKAPWMKDKNLQLIRNMEELKSFIDKAIQTGLCALDLETTGISSRVKKISQDGKVVYKPVNKIVGFCISCDVNHGIYVPINHQEADHLNLPEKEVFDEIQRLCANSVTIYHNAKFDINFLRIHGINVTQYNRFEDTLILARLYDAGQKQIGLKYLSDKFLKQTMIEFDEICPNGRLDLISPEIAYLYGAADAVCTLQLFKFFIEQDIIKQQMAIYNLEKRVVNVVIEMENNLIMIDAAYLEKLKAAVETKMSETQKEIYTLVGKEFKLNSPQELGRVLFDELGYRYPEKKKTAGNQYITEGSTLEKIADEYPVVSKIIEYRGLEKAVGTYITNLLKNRDKDNCVKLSFNQTGTDTGRFSSPGGDGIEVDGYCGVNIQSMPTKDSEGVPELLKEMPIRRAFIARPGYKIVAMDYSGEELRVTTNYSHEQKWIDEFQNGDGDLHTKTGQVIFNRQEITKTERKTAKTTNFLIVYGGGPHALAAKAKISEREARRILMAFFDGLPQLKKWIDVERVRARKLKMVKTAFGRIRPLHMFYDSGDKAMEAHGDRCAVNTEIQGSCADIMKTSMVRVYNWIHNNNFQDDIRMLITVHDEIVFEMRENKIAEYIPKINNILKLEDILQKVLQWPIPLTVDAEYGDSWNVDHNFFKENPQVKNIDTIIFQKKDQVPTAPVETKDSMELVHSDESAKTEVSKIQEQQKQIQKPVPNEMDLTEGHEFVYTLKDLRKSTNRILNSIVSFVLEENKDAGYKGPIKILKIVDKEGHVLNVSDHKVYVDAFLSLARYYGI